jgi:acetyltransferase-like isoleucine patch superfamily enzyme
VPADPPRPPDSRAARAFRVGCTAIAIVVVETIVCGIAMMPAMGLWAATASLPVTIVPRPVLFSVIAVPSYVAFAVTLMIVSPLASWLTRARTVPSVDMRIDGLSWPLLAWARYMAAIHVVRVFAGSLVRGSPLWTAYVRLNGARIGRRVYINTVHISDHNLLQLGDDVVIGSEVHISGHTVEGGVVKTAPVRLGSGVTVGLGTVLEIGVDAGDGCQIGALSFVPKFTTLEGNGTYVGAPVRRLKPDTTAALSG